MNWPREISKMNMIANVLETHYSDFRNCRNYQSRVLFVKSEIILTISEIITMGLKDIDNHNHFGSISRANSCKSDKIAAHEWVSGSPADFSLQRSWLT